MRDGIVNLRNSYRVNGSVATLTVTRRDGSTVEAIFDAADLDHVRSKCWRVSSGRSDRQYPATGTYPDPVFALSHHIVGRPSGDNIVYHANNNAFDCRRINILVGTTSEMRKNLYRLKRGEK